MIGLVDAAAEVASTKHSDVKPVEIPKEIGESKSKLSDVPKEIGEKPAKVQDAPKEIGKKVKVLFESADKNTYYALRKARDDDANKTYLEILEKEADGLYIQDIMRGGIKNDDPRIPRNLSK